MYFSIHRSDYGMFYPQTGFIHEIGNKNGIGYNINIPLNGNYGDFEYISIFKYILIPIGIKFKPDLIVISAGFDACIHHYVLVI